MRRSMMVCLPYLFAAASAMAQPDSVLVERIAVIARPAKDSVTLRWAALNYLTWQTGNKEGYRIERYVISRNGRLLSEPEKTVLQTMIKPQSEEQWTHLLSKNRYAAIAAQALFGDRFEVDLQQSDIFTIVNKVRENEQRFAFALFCADMSPVVAKASGLWYTDKTTRSGEKYLYRVIINGPHPSMGSAFVGPDDEYRLPAPQNLGGDFNDGTVNLRWDRVASSPFTAFALERSSDARNFRRVSETPQITLSPGNENSHRHEYATDSLADNSAVYYYRVRGVTPFGEEGPPSNVFSGHGSASVERVPYIVSAQSPNNTTILLEWDFPEASNAAIHGFQIERSEGPKNRYRVLHNKLIDPKERTYEDLSPRQSNYYRIRAHGRDGELYTSHAYFAQLIDSVPPAIPTGLKAVANDSGKVVLSWTPNRENDIYGYRVYRSWFQSEEPSQVTDSPITTDRFTDEVPLGTLNESVYYSVMAVDASQNHSRLSPTTEVSLPDTLKPQPPILLPSVSDTTGVLISWAACGSTDVVDYEVFRKPSDIPGWIPVGVVKASDDSVFYFLDGSCVPGSEAYYTVLSRDDAGLESEPARPVRRVCPASLEPPVKWNKSRISVDENKVELSWTYAATGLDRFSIFRSVNNGSSILLSSVDGLKNYFIDTVIPGRAYSYRIVASFRDGKKSEMSEVLTLRL